MVSFPANNLSLADVSMNNLNYTGEKLTPSVNTIALGGKKIDVKNVAFDYDMITGDMTNLGEQTVMLRFKGNYCGTVSVSFTINNRPNFTPPVLQGTSLTHHSSELALIKTAGSVTAGQGTMYYALTTANTAPDEDSALWTDNASEIKVSKADIYYVWYKVTGADDYELIPTKLGSVKVKQYSAPSYYSQSWKLKMDSYQFDGTAHEPEFIGSAYGDITYTYYNDDTDEELSAAPFEPGNYRVKVFAEGGPRYYSRTQEISFSILNPFDKNNKNKMTEVSAFKKNNVIPTVEGKVFAGWFTDSSCTTPYTGDSGKAFAKFIDEKILTVKAQVSGGTTANSASTAIRFITSLDSLKYENIGFKITFNGKTIDQKLTKVYTTLLANGQKVQPGVFSTESHYMGAFTLNNIPSSVFGKEFTVTPYYTTEDGTVVEGETKSFTIAKMIK